MFEELLPWCLKSFDLISPSAPELVAGKLFFALQIPFLFLLLKKQTVGGRLWLAQRVGCAALSHFDTVWASGHSHTFKQIRSALFWTMSTPGPPPDSDHNAKEKHPLETQSDRKYKTWQCNCFQATIPDSFFFLVNLCLWLLCKCATIYRSLLLSCC